MVDPPKRHSFAFLLKQFETCDTCGGKIIWMREYRAEGKTELIGDCTSCKAIFTSGGSFIKTDRQDS